MKKLGLYSLLVLTVVFMMGCGAGKISIDQAYYELKPVKQLEFPEQTTENFVIKLENVADSRSSYKNYVEVFVNGKLVEPNWNVSNTEEDFEYRMKVRPGYYEVKAFYYAHLGWGKEKYEIEAKELARVSHDKVTKFYYNIAKDSNGLPVNRVMYFKTSEKDIK